MTQELSFLRNLKDDIFKLIPMKEDEIYKGISNYTDEYLESLLINLKGATITFPELSVEKQYIAIINRLNYLKERDVEFQLWRRIVFNSLQSIRVLVRLYGGERNDK